jgi:hypothetical protein
MEMYTLQFDVDSLPNGDFTIWCMKNTSTWDDDTNQILFVG